MTIADVLFTCLGVICAASGLLAVTTRQLVHSALWLTLSMVALSGCFLVLGAELVALVQLLIYVGAVVVLVLFAMMLTRAPIGKRSANSVSAGGQISAFVIAAATGGLLFAAFWAAFGASRYRLRGGSTQVLATNLFARYSWPFEVLSLVLLVALVAGLALLGASRQVAIKPSPSGVREPAKTSAASSTPENVSAGASAEPENTTSESTGDAAETSEPAVEPENSEGGPA